MAHQNPAKTSFARHLRHVETAAEVKLWQQLRGRKLDGLKFVRQLPIGPYVVDFACREKKFVLEVDGATHGNQSEMQYDAMRTAFLEGQGWTVLRLTNEDVYRHVNWVCDSILRRIGR